MRHRWRTGRLHVSGPHQRAMGRNLIASLFEHGRVTTTMPKAKAFRPIAERLITLARKGNVARDEGDAEGKAAYLHAVRLAARSLPTKGAVKRLFDVVAPAVRERPGGYTRILRLSGNRLGDNASRALFELVDPPLVEETPEPAKGKKKREKAAPAK